MLPNTNVQQGIDPADWDTAYRLTEWLAQNTNRPWHAPQFYTLVHKGLVSTLLIAGKTLYYRPDVERFAAGLRSAA